MSATITTNLRSRCTTLHCHVSAPFLQFKRLAHTKHSTNPFPYPTLRNPTPHQIFHLPPNATQGEIKARYYDLVRLYHPDKLAPSLCAISVDEAHARFQAVTAAYDKLRGKNALGASSECETTGTKWNQYQTTAAYRAMQRRRQELYNSGSVDDSKMDKWLIAGVVATISFVVIHNTMTRREFIEAVSRSRAINQSRRTQEAERLSAEPVNNRASPRLEISKT